MSADFRSRTSYRSAAAARPGRAWRRFAIWHAAASSLLLLVLGLRYFAASSPPGDGLGWAFVLLAAPPHCFALAGLAAVPVWVAASLRPGRWLLPLSALLQAVPLVAVAVDTQVYALYRWHVDGTVLGLLGSGSALEVLRPNTGDLADLALLLAVALALSLALAFASERAARRLRTRSAWLALLLVPFLAGQLLHAWADANAVTSVARLARVLPWLPALTSRRWLAARGFGPDPGAAGVSVPPLRSDLDYPRQPPDCRARPGDVRIVVIVIEEWRFDELDPMTTPEIWRFASDALVFERHVSSGSTSRYGVFGLMYGLHGDYWESMLAEQRGPVLIDALDALGARFFVAATAPLTRPEFDRTVFAALRGRVPFVRTTGSPSDGDRQITEAFAEFVAATDGGPFFAFLYYDSPHSMDVPPGWRGPHQPARPWGSRLALDARTDPAPLWRAHANSVHYVDSRVGEALEALRRKGLLEGTAIVITGDHGEEFNELGRGYWGHDGNFARFQTQVGMVAQLPGRPPARIASLTSHVDVVPTLMRDVLDCRAPVDAYSNGRPLLDAPPRDLAVVSGGSLGVGIVEPGRITTIDRLGDVRVLDPDLRSAPDARPDAAALRRVFAQLTAFRGGRR